MQHNNPVLSRIIILVLFLALPIMAWPVDLKLPSKVSRELNKQKIYQDGAKAMADQLHRVASVKFREVLADKKLSDTAKPYVTLALAEALIRTSISSRGLPKQAEEALELLQQKSVSDLPSSPIWKAEALASLGRYNEASATLAEIPATHPLHNQTQLARAKILIALDRAPDALNILVPLGQMKTATIRDRANLLAAEIYLNEGRYDSTQQTIELVDSQNPADAKIKEYLAARLALAEKKNAEAISRFQSLITAPNDLQKRIFNACILGKADAQAANGQTSESLATIEQFIDQNPESPALPSAFVRIPSLLPADVGDDASIFAKLIEWADTNVERDDVLYKVGDTAAGIPYYQPELSDYRDRVSLALYYHAVLLARTENTEKQKLAMALLAKLRVQNNTASQPLSELYLRLSSASLLDTAFLHLKQNQPELATFTLSVMEKVAFSPRLKDQASFLRGLLLAQKNDLEASLEAFNFARQSSSEDIANAATINAGILALKNSNLEAFANVLE
ncbi:MAG: hypothetical protein KJO79_02375, partial [Verrucomicrobiae bacterium]|nr:hypothetical protein [Verrucomicrobiae bacterium]NNJ86000.1 hypothetical protein [Akkermansiaceae bacterium]